MTPHHQWIAEIWQIGMGVEWISVLGRTRTSDPLLRRQVLYPAELLGHGAEGGTRTRTPLKGTGF